jgi:hypothetical protein
MTIKLKFPGARGGGGKHRSRAKDPVVRSAIGGFLLLSLALIGFFAYWYVKYDRIIEQRFRGPVFATSAKIYASPRVVRTGSKETINDIAAELRRAGYSENGPRANAPKPGPAESPLGCLDWLRETR